LTSRPAQLQSSPRAHFALQVSTHSAFPVEEEPMSDDLEGILGGPGNLALAIESFYKKVFADDTLRSFFETTDMAQLLARQRMFISMLLGGQDSYTGKDIASAHAQARTHGLNDGHFDRFVHHFREALKEVGVPPEKSEKVARLLESHRRSVLNP
jgi:truncated hemoglobin YjbI